jgi:hypothetical protein
MNVLQERPVRRFDQSSLILKRSHASPARRLGWRASTGPKLRAAGANRVGATSADEAWPLFEGIAIPCDRKDQCSRPRSRIPRTSASIVLKQGSFDQRSALETCLTQSKLHSRLTMTRRRPSTESSIMRCQLTLRSCNWSPRASAAWFGSSAAAHGRPAQNQGSRCPHDGSCKYSYRPRGRLPHAQRNRS